MSREKQLEKLVVTLEAKTAKYKADLDKARSKSKSFAKNTKKDAIDIKGALAGIGFAFATKKIIDATAKQEKAVKQLEQGLKSTANAAGFSLSQLTQYASELQRVTTFGDEDIIAAQSQLVTFTRITGNEFKRTMQAALDLSTRMDQDLKSSVLQLGKALNDPVANMGALTRSGIQFTDQQKEMIKALVKSGDQVGAQKLILKELETQFGGSARAARDTFGGALKGLDNAFGDLLESSGGLEDARVSVEKLTKLLSDPSIVSGVNTLTSAIIKGFSGALGFVTDTVNAVKFLAEEFAAFNVGPAIDDIVRIQDEITNLEAKISVIDNMMRTSPQVEARRERLAGELKLLKDQLKLALELQTLPPPKPLVIDINNGQASDTPEILDNEKDKTFKFIKDPKNLDKFENLMDEYAVVSENTAAYIEDSFTSAFNNMTDNMSRGLAQAIVEGESLKDVFGQVAKTLAIDMVASLIKVGAQMLINAALGKAAQAEEVIAANILGPTIAAAYSGAAAMVSLATLGGNAIPAQTAIGSTVALSAGLAGMAHDGIDNVPKEGTWLLDKGERVLSSRQNQDFSNYMKGSGGEKVSVTNVFQISAGVEGTVQTEIKKLLPAIERLSQNSVEKAIRGGGSLARAVGAR